jgi:AcrR family transcriptional regulator
MFVNSHSRRRGVPRRSPVQGRARETVERILDAAAHVFGERGYAATTNDVAERAGVSIGSLYQYFRDKDALLVALHDRHLDQIARELLGRGPVDDPEAWVRWLVAELIARNTRPDAQVLWETSRVLPAMRARVTELVDDLAGDAATVLGLRSRLRARAVVVTALAVVHEVALPHPTPARRRVAVSAVLAVARDGRATPANRRRAERTSEEARTPDR